MWAILVLGAAEVINTDGRVRSAELRVEAGECAAKGVTDHFHPSKQIGDIPSAPVEVAEPDMAADLISIQYADNFKIVTEDFSKEQYILTQCGATQPTDEEVDAVAALEEGYTRKFFTIPLQTVMVEGTVAASFLSALGVEDRVVYVNEYASAPCWQKAIECGAGISAARPEQREALDAVFMDCSYDGDCANVNDVPNAIHISSSQDPGPLHSAEHIKFVAAFFNKEELATSLFTETVRAYCDTSSAAGGPIVAWVGYSPKSDWSEESFTISMATYKLHYVEAAGGSNPDREDIIAALGHEHHYVLATEEPMGWTLSIVVDDHEGGKAAAAGVFKKVVALAGVDAVIDETYAYDPSSYTLETFLSNFELESSSELKFIEGKKVFRIDGTHTPSPSFGLDWFESRLAHPEWAVEGLKRVLYGDDKMDRHYFRNVAAGELSEVISHESCSKEKLPQCFDDVYPEGIPTIAKPMPSDSDSAAAFISAALFFWAF
jgi:hypothetical protein